jgi:hypothetical protein
VHRLSNGAFSRNHNTSTAQEEAIFTLTCLVRTAGTELETHKKKFCYGCSRIGTATAEYKQQ